MGDNCKIFSMSPSSRTGIISKLLLAVLLTLSACSNQDYKNGLTGVNDVLILDSLKQIGDLGRENILLTFSKKISGENGIIYRAFYRVSGNREMKTYLPFIKKLTGNAYSSRIRCEAIRTLGKINALEASDRVKELLEDKDIEVALTTIIAIAQIGKSEFVEYIKPLLGKPELVSYAIWCIGRIGKPEDASLIAPFLRSNDTDIAFIAFKTLRRMG